MNVFMSIITANNDYIQGANTLTHWCLVFFWVNVFFPYGVRINGN